MAVGVAVSGSAFGQFWTRSTMTNDAVESYDQQLAKLTLAASLGATFQLAKSARSYRSQAR